jgi:hypothetical protein
MEDPYIASVLNNPLLLRNILIQSDYNIILDYCRSYKQAEEVCRDNVFWEQKAEKDFNVTRDVFRDTALSPVQRYFHIFTE